MTTITGQRSLINIAKEKIAYSISKGGNQKPKIEEGQTMLKRKSTKGQTMICKILHGKLKIEQEEFEDTKGR